MVTKRWKIKHIDDSSSVGGLQTALGVERIIASLLVQRGVSDFETARSFFRPLTEMLHDPFLMKDMDKAIARLAKAIDSGERILVFGDYDVDGTTAVALVYSFIKQMTPHVEYYIPDRYSEGYGVSIKGIDHAKATGCSLIISLDCGIKAVDKVEYSNAQGLDFIVCDHHLPGASLPPALAVLDPKREDCEYPYKELSGCGIGFKVIQALCRHYKVDEQQAFDYLDLVAISIAADIVPITGENRILAYYGLLQLNNSPRPGIRALLALNNYNKELNISSLVFVLGPRINAAGRIEHGSKAVELLISETEEEANVIAQSINTTNSQRKDLDMGTTSEAMLMLESDPMTPFRRSTVLFSEGWHKGVIGIVASRLIEKYYKPTIVLTESNGKATGSARSVKDFDVYQAIEKCSDLLEQFGGHKYAAGLTMKKENIEAFKTKFEEVVNSAILPEMLQPEVEIDMDIQLHEINDKLMRILKQLAPHGPGNMTPVFYSTGVLDAGYVKIVGERHLKLDLLQPSHPSIRFSAIAFDKADYLHFFQKKIPVDIVYKLTENEYRGVTNIQLVIDEIRASA